MSEEALKFQGFKNFQGGFEGKQIKYLGARTPK